MDVKIEESWKNKLKEEFNKEYFEQLTAFVKEEYAAKKIYPPANLIFNAFNLCPYDKVKVVIIGQDPYHGVNQANGLSFSVNPEVRTPPSLQNIYKELHSDLGVTPPVNGDLSRWAEQGVLLLNATLTVQASQPASHQKKGWEQFTDNVIKLLSDDKENLVFILWGKYAKDKGAVIDRTKHLVIESPHPSPYAANYGFFGSKPFSRTNAYLKEHGISEIEW
jgi:uracil-DNA glycosylase